MHPYMSDDRSMRWQTEEMLRRAEHVRLADEARRARKARSRGQANGSRQELGPDASRRLRLATPALRDQGMPPEEIDAILAADDPEVIRRYLDLHRERLEERLADQRRTVGHLLQVITTSTEGRRPSRRRKHSRARLVSLTSEEGVR